jgi:hypothetical protein
MTAWLRPLRLGEILDRTFEIYRSRFLAFLGISALPVAAKMALILLGLLADALIKQTTLSYAVKQALDGDIKWFASRIAETFFTFLVWPVFALLVGQIVASEELNIRLTFQSCFVRWRSWLLLGGCFWLIGSELPLQLRTRVLSSAWLSMPLWLGALLTMFEGFALLAPLLLSVPAWSLEKIGVSNAIARSWTLSKSTYGRMFVAWLLSDLIGWSLSLLLGGLLFLIFQLVAGSQWTPYAGYVKFWLTFPANISRTLIAPLVPIALTLFYYDQRIRLEGFDIEKMMDAAGMNVPVLAHTPEAKILIDPVEETQG